MRRVAASPQALVLLSHRLADQADDYRRVSSRLRAECAPGDPLVPVLDECTRIADQLARSMADVTAFVVTVARDLEAADHTLAGVVDRSGRRGGDVVLASGGAHTIFVAGRGAVRADSGPRTAKALRQARRIPGDCDHHGPTVRV